MKIDFFPGPKNFADFVFGFEKRNVGNCLKHVFPNFCSKRMWFRGVSGRSKFWQIVVPYVFSESHPNVSFWSFLPFETWFWSAPTTFFDIFLTWFLKTNFKGFWTTFWKAFGVKNAVFDIFFHFIFRSKFWIDFWSFFSQLLTRQTCQNCNFLMRKRRFSQCGHSWVWNGNWIKFGWFWGAKINENLIKIEKNDIS